MPFTENALFILEKFYYKRDRNGNLIEKTPEEIFHRVASFVASSEQDPSKRKQMEKVFYNLMLEQKFMFSSPTLFNAKSDFPLCSSCFVGGMEDDMVSIMKAATDTAITFKAGAGMGLNFGVLRPKGARVGRGGTSSGPVSFMRLFDEVGETVKSGGVRRAAFMAMMDVSHPDIEEFISSKDFIAQLKQLYPHLEIPDTFVDNIMNALSERLKETIDDPDIISGTLQQIRRQVFEPLSNMNISVAITDSFMEAVKSDKEFVLDSGHGITKKIRARELFHKIALSAWRTADPGVWFIDCANEYDTVPSFGRILSTNPCGEQSLHSYTSCNLGSINLVAFVKDGKFDWDGYQETIALATRALDDVIDVAAFPTEEFREKTLKIRPVGLGFTGLAEVLFKLRLSYASEEGRAFASAVARELTQHAIRTSIELGKEKGSFPLFEENKEALIRVVKHYFDTEEEKANIEKAILSNGIRNSNWTTLAPTGTISLILDAYTYSLEPQFALAYHKNLVDGGRLVYVDPAFREAVKDDPAIIDKVIENGGSCQNIPGISEEIKKVFVVAHDIHYEDRIKMQACLQRYISNSISSTINLPSTTTVEEIESIYLKAWESGLKGITIYRDGCKSFQPMTTTKKTTSQPVITTESHPRWKRPKTLPAEIIKTKTGSGTLYTSIGLDERGWPIEIFINISKHGSEVSAFSEALGRVISIALQNGVSPLDLADTLIGITGDSITWDNGKVIKSVPDAIGKILKEYGERMVSRAQEGLLFETEPESPAAPDPQHTKSEELPGSSVCPKCGEKTLVKSEDCVNCLSCGYSKCG
ncbi:adenosylcobalamin-dependent ribonucleoside-diphosphate reductase [Thermospira aquatica]|uniref:Vitamin B12-dependent ribonucleotide reductase n=1 Tax=Thermospira aquatica TaxID=2828656 RepID=A0AAX3BE53_9SPIR|nr:adenosylcobalamin-dependent ribonucleoside-diphosphate reductase [Thermospira aquatica]URA10329.1 adenosylcobalamin-dependent ribonucleoside-diphosphate reductase [Thermospira aquatica]